jgi:hypothetical protein
VAVASSTYQGLGGAVQGVTVVAAEFGVNTTEGGVTVGLGLLDTVWEVACQSFGSL